MTSFTRLFINKSGTDYADFMDLYFKRCAAARHKGVCRTTAHDVCGSFSLAPILGIEQQLTDI